MRIIGLDVGEKTIGIAISDEMGWTAQGLEVIHRKKIENDLTRLQEIINQYGVEQIVAGLPKNMNGTLGPRAKMVQKLATMLENHFKLPVILWDERLTTVSAERTLIQADMSRQKRKKVIDKIAAILILQNYLDSKR